MSIDPKPSLHQQYHRHNPVLQERPLDTAQSNRRASLGLTYAPVLTSGEHDLTAQAMHHRQRVAQNTTR